MALHTPSSSGQHRFPECGPIAGPCPYEYEQVHEESQGTDHAVRYGPLPVPVSSYRQGKKKDSSLEGHHGTTIPPDPTTFFSSSDQPSMFLIILPGPGGSGE